MKGEKGTLVLAEKTRYYLLGRYFSHILPSIAITSVCWTVVPLALSEGLSFFTRPANVLFFLFVMAISGYFVHHGILGLRRTRLRLYTNGIVPYFKPLDVFWKGEEYFVPWEEIPAVVYYGKGAYYYSSDKFHHTVYLPGKYGVSLFPNVFPESRAEVSRKIESLNLEERTKVLDWDDPKAMTFSRRRGLYG